MWTRRIKWNRGIRCLITFDHGQSLKPGLSIPLLLKSQLSRPCLKQPTELVNCVKPGQLLMISYWCYGGYASSKFVWYQFWPQKVSMVNQSIIRIILVSFVNVTWTKRCVGLVFFAANLAGPGVTMAVVVNPRCGRFNKNDIWVQPNIRQILTNNS